MQQNYYIGLMSGTSLDGVDLALMDFSRGSPKLAATDFMPMPEALRTQLSALCNSGNTSLQLLGELDHRLALLYVDIVNRFLQSRQLNPQWIRAIGCHGQTIWHSPNGRFPFSMQIGDANLLAAKTGIDVVADFRRKDMAFGGQGAPLVPAFHHAVFSETERVNVVLNIGGISNISVLAPQQAVIGYDTGPGNTLLDAWIERHQGKRYDQDGAWAKCGRVSPALLSALLDEPFFSLKPPKSTGRELFNLAWLTQKMQNVGTLSASDVQATLLEFSVQSIVGQLQPIAAQSGLPCRLLVCGGGAKNRLMMQRLTALLPEWTVQTTTDCGLDGDSVEAAAFAWLAYRRMHGLSANLPSVTGAQSAVSLGAIYPAEPAGNI
ncbi:anhydro-N-acetylmuramic acid kinase [Chelonobacter oris]|uniref:Anhydro-N-acetylmuramic acid kinase n=1 Tax=Chelonobacter oris TaxID=505317 RepID=A0A0A3APT2_9PAST|nr:anhydro-N-acetylmuramic acid kinase [Chelonobacter oris]KGQ69762.1 anhydro-N-acetylmuramic acid kinase [Chelonobacter oris]MDH2999947.1 anhydro-N-acetylmuramic acid kinase [Chelonobacter oris]